MPIVGLWSAPAWKRLTPFHSRHYSDGMISDFDQLSEKIRQLAELTQSLRRENADLRLQASALAAENIELAQRMQQAHQRVSRLLETIPVATPDREPV